MKKLLNLLLFGILLIPAVCSAQFYIEPFTGFQQNIGSFQGHAVNSGLQFAYHRSKTEFLLQVQKNWPLISHGVDSSYTLNTSLPLYAPAQKTISPGLFSIALGMRILLAGGESPNRLFLKIYGGVMSQNIKVNYSYDKANYTIMNPDQTVDIAGWFGSGGVEYMHLFKRNRLFIDLNLSSAPTGQVYYPSSFDPLAPLSLNIGYSIKISNH